MDGPSSEPLTVSTRNLWEPWIISREEPFGFFENCIKQSFLDGFRDGFRVDFDMETKNSMGTTTRGSVFTRFREVRPHRRREIDHPTGIPFG